MSSYFSLIPSGVMNNDKLSDGAKITYALILGLSNQYGYCFATNTSLANMRKTSESSLKRHLKELLDANAIETEYNRRNDRRIKPNVYATPMEKHLKNKNDVVYTSIDPETEAALDMIWKSIKPYRTS